MRLPTVSATVEGKASVILAEALRKSEIAVTQAVTGATAALKANWRGQVRAALGGRLAGAVRGEVYPKGGTSLDAVGLVWTKAPQIIGAHEKGATIRAANGVWLAIPLPAAGRGRPTPGEWQFKTGRKLRFVQTGPVRGVLLAKGEEVRVNGRGTAVRRRARERKGATRMVSEVPIFAMVRQVRLKKVMDLKGAGQAAGATLSSRLRAALRAQR